MFDNCFGTERLPVYVCVLLNDARIGDHDNYAPQVVMVRVVKCERHRRKSLSSSRRHGKCECALALRRCFPTRIRNILPSLIDWTVFDAGG